MSHVTDVIVRPMFAESYGRHRRDHDRDTSNRGEHHRIGVSFRDCRRLSVRRPWGLGSVNGFFSPNSNVAVRCLPRAHSWRWHCLPGFFKLFGGDRAHLHRHDADGAMLAEHAAELLIACGAFFNIFRGQAFAASFAEPEIHKLSVLRSLRQSFRDLSGRLVELLRLRIPLFLIENAAVVQVVFAGSKEE